MARALAFDNDADDEIMERHLGKPYNRKLYNQLATIKKLKDAEIGEIDRSTYLSPRYRDIRAYLHNNRGDAEIDTSLVACSHATSPAQCRLAQASMVQANRYTGLTLNQRLRALARAPSLAMGMMARPSLVSFLARRLARRPSGSGSHGEVSRYATAIQKKRSPLLLKDREDRTPPDSGSGGGGGGGKSRTHKSRKSRKGRKNRKSRKNRNI